MRLPTTLVSAFSYAACADIATVNICTLDPTRTKLYPEVPAVAELLPGFTNTTWYGLLGPARIPQHVVNKVNAEMKLALADPEFRKRLEALGLDPVSSTPRQLHERIVSELARWTKVIKEAGIGASS